MSRHFITTLLLVAALLCYWLGAGRGGSMLLVLGVVFELAFWLRALRKGKPRV